MQAPVFDKNIKVQELQDFSKNTLSDHLGIEFLEVGDDFVSARMPVDDRTVQPHRLLHGGASVALAETLGSLASSLLIDRASQAVVGLEINANHIKSAREGFVIGTASPIHLGKKTHVWDIRIENEDKQLVSISRLTVAIIDRKK